jgi:Protein of unknown function (DUF3037)
MADLRKLEYFLLRYVPNAARQECINIGLVLTERGGGGFAGAHFVRDWRRAHCLFPDTDEEMLEAVGREISEQLKTVEDRARLLGRLMESYSGVIEISPVYSWEGEDPAHELKTLSASLVETGWMSKEFEEVRARRAGRRFIRSEMTNTFEAKGVLKLLQTDLPVSMYTNPTDKFTFDFAYSIGAKGEETKIFHAVSLVDRGKDTEMFPLRVAKIAPKLAQDKRTRPTFTAIVEDHFDAEDAYVASILAFMKDENIQVSSLQQMPAIAERARVELGA